MTAVNERRPSDATAPVAELWRETIASVQRVLRGELRLAVARARDDAGDAARGVALRLVALTLGLVVFILLNFAAVAYLATRMEQWLAAVAVASVNCLVAILLWFLPLTAPSRAPSHVVVEHRSSGT